MAGQQDQQLPEPAELARIFARIAEQSQSLIANFLQQQAQAGVIGLSDSLRIGNAFMDMTQHMLHNPSQLVNAQLALWQGYWDLWQHTANFWGQQVLQKPPEVKQSAQEEPDFLFDFIKQSYLLTARCLQSVVAHTEGLDESTCKRLDFYTRQFIETMAAGHFPASNPDVLHKTITSGGDNLLQGLQNLLKDLEYSKNRLSLQQTKSLIGTHIATTPGAVIFQNELMQLLQYNPATAQVWRRPLLIVPPWINKYYLLDLGAENSFIKWCVEQGLTVFVISWVNPNPEVADKEFGDYIGSGVLAALSAIEQATGVRSINAIGYCLGGVLLACTAAYLAQRRENRLRSCTYLTTLLDFEQPGELEVYIDEEELSALDREAKNIIRKPTITFNMLRANDLIWSYFVNNYLLGKEPLPFDLLYWNADSTRMPAKMHSFYLRNMYQNNLLREAGGIALLGKPIDLSKVKTPSYYLATIEDYITPWRSIYSSALLFSGSLRFVLAGSGHIAGVINPPQTKKYGYWTQEQAEAKQQDANDWISAAKRHEGSWWPDWLQWVKLHCGAQVAPRHPGEGQLPVIENAPGSYVLVR